MGATPAMELYVLYDEVSRVLEDRELSVHRAHVGDFFTSLDMMGASLTVLKLDDELKELMDMDAFSVGLKHK
jgi:dihydroxyacetone kinase-like protein